MALAPTLVENRDRIIAGTAEVAARGGRLAVFPENALAGRGNDVALDVDAATEAIRRAADAQNIYVLFGGATFSPATKKDIQWARAFGPDGAALFFYEKLYSNPRAPMPGIFNIDGVPCSAMICADRWLRGVDDLPIQQGAQVSFELACNFASEWVEPLGWYWYVPRALRNNVWIVFANTGNPAGPTADLPRHGHSAVISPDGRLLAGSSDAAGIVMAEFDPATATRAEAIARSSHPALRAFWDAALLKATKTLPDFELGRYDKDAEDLQAYVTKLWGDGAK
jgi:predicted amidohydrolase